MKYKANRINQDSIGTPSADNSGNRTESPFFLNSAGRRLVARDLPIFTLLANGA